MKEIVLVLCVGGGAGIIVAGFMCIALVVEILAGLLLRAILPDDPERSFVHTNPRPTTAPPTSYENDVR